MAELISWMAGTREKMDQTTKRLDMFDNATTPPSAPYEMCVGALLETRAGLQVEGSSKETFDSGLGGGR